MNKDSFIVFDESEKLSYKAKITTEEDLLEKLKDLGWEPPEGGMSDFTRRFLNAARPDIDELVDNTHRALHLDSQWVECVSFWEEPMVRVEVRQQRKMFVSEMVARNVTPEFLSDSKKRWESAEFSSVGDFLTIGDISVKKLPSCKLPRFDEVDIEAEGGDLGRTSITYDFWHANSRIDRVRLKINGDRFVVDGKFLKGYQTYEFTSPTSYKVLERYGGSFYSILPVTSVPGTIHVRWKGKECVFAVFPHPYVLYSSIPQSSFESHKYDGIMCEINKFEYRAKWHPSKETLIDNETWEVCLINSQIVKIKARPGKFAFKEEAIFQFLPAEVPGKSLLKAISSSHLLLNDFVIEKETIEGTKIIFFTEDGRYPLFLENGKRWDFPGGRIESGESPDIAACRELREELHLVISPLSLISVGTTIEMSDAVEWVSHVFVALCPSQLLLREDLCFFSLTFAELKYDASCRPRQQWVDRHLDYLHRLGIREDFATLLKLKSLKVLTKCSINSFKILKIALPYYATYLGRYWDGYKLMMEKSGLVYSPPTKTVFERFLKQYFFHNDPSYMAVFAIVYDMCMDIGRTSAKIFSSKICRSFDNNFTVEEMVRILQCSYEEAQSVFNFLVNSNIIHSSLVQKFLVPETWSDFAPIQRKKKKDVSRLSNWVSDSNGKKEEDSIT